MITDPATGQTLPQGETGQIEVRGPNVFKGYWRMPEKTAGEFRADGWFITGDLATMDDSGRVTIVGRAKDLIVVRMGQFVEDDGRMFDHLVPVQQRRRSRHMHFFR